MPIAPTAVALERLPRAEYPPVTAAPYDPSEAFPEWPTGRVASAPNPVFAAVRAALHNLGLDAARYGTPQWNPIGELIQPGGRVVVKPNWVLHYNQGEGGMDCMITHPSVLRVVLDYVFLARPSRVVLGDAPLQGCNFEQMLDHGGLRSVIRHFQAQGLPLEVQDFRRTVMKDDGRYKTGVSENQHPEHDYVQVDLGTESLLEPLSANWKAFRVTVYDPRKMWRHHRPGRHQYLLAREVLEADLVVNVPKLKVHKKAGMTCCLKNLIGINGNKEYLPHHRKGAPDGRVAGDNYEYAHWKLSLAENLLDAANAWFRGMPGLYRLLERVAWRLMVKRRSDDPSAQLEGSWYGNDTIWRTCLDLNRALLHADRAGRLQPEAQRRELSIVDAVVAGQGEGPLAPEPLATGAVYAAHNPAIGDVLGAGLLGLDARKIPLLQHAFDAVAYGFSSLCLQEAQDCVDGLLHSFAPFPPARAPHGWAGHIEK